MVGFTDICPVDEALVEADAPEVDPGVIENGPEETVIEYACGAVLSSLRTPREPTEAEKGTQRRYPSDQEPALLALKRTAVEELRKQQLGLIVP